MNLLTVIRWVHVLTAAAWLGEVVAINFVLVPALVSLPIDRRGAFIRRLFPRLFRLASLLAFSTLASGLLMSYLLTGWRNLGELIKTPWGATILAGGVIGFLLATFHFVVESRLKPAVEQLNEASSEADLNRVTRFLQIVPRAGLVVITVAFLLMMMAARS